MLDKLKIYIVIPKKKCNISRESFEQTIGWYPNVLLVLNSCAKTLDAKISSLSFHLNIHIYIEMNTKITNSIERYLSPQCAEIRPCGAET